MNYGDIILLQKRISSRLVNLLKAAVNIAAETAIDTSVNVLISKACEKIEISLKTLYKKTARNSIISFAINLLGILCFGINIGEIYLPALKKVPDIPQLIDSLIGLFWKRITLYAGIVASYTIIIFGIIKPVLIYKLTK